MLHALRLTQQDPTFRALKLPFLPAAQRFSEALLPRKPGHHGRALKNLRWHCGGETQWLQTMTKKRHLMLSAFSHCYEAETIRKDGSQVTPFALCTPKLRPLLLGRHGLVLSLKIKGHYNSNPRLS